MHRGLIHHQIIKVSNVKKSALFYAPMLEYFGYELSGSDLESEYSYQDWKRWDHDTPHEISICDVSERLSHVEHVRGAVGHHDHIAFCAASRSDVDKFYSEVLVPLERDGLCTIEDPPCDCPEYGDGYYATFFYDPDGLKYEFVINPNHLIKKQAREEWSNKKKR